MNASIDKTWHSKCTQRDKIEYPGTFWKAIEDMADAVEDAKNQESITKQELIAELELLLVHCMKKMVATPTCTSYSIFR
jgi:hypothetical protein